jgi:hypothetical protein
MIERRRTRKSLLRLQNHLFSLTPPLGITPTAVLPLILLSAPDSLEFFALDLTRLLDLLGQMPVSVYPLDFRHVLVSLDKRCIVFQLLALSSALDTLTFGGASAPESNIAVVAAGEDVIVIGGPGGGKHALHAFCMVDVSAVSCIAVPEADAAVVRGRDQFLACRGKLDVHYGGDVVFEDV